MVDLPRALQRVLRTPVVRRPRLVWPVVVAALVGAAAPADASVVTSARSFQPGVYERAPKVGDISIPPTTTYRLSVAAGPGEANALRFELAPQGFVVRDAAGITPGEGCAAVDATTASCATPPEPGTAYVTRGIARVMLEDGDDTVTLPPSTPGYYDVTEVDAGGGNDVVVGAGKATGGPGDDRLDAIIADGGPGDDTITANDADGGDGRDTLGPRGPAPAKLRGGPGDDVLAGRPESKGAAVYYVRDGDVLDGGEGNDRLTAGPGDDRLVPGPGADVIDGGPGVDFVSFATATAPVRADLAASAPVDPTGEGDAMTGVESAEGGSGDDVLLATPEASVLIGNGGDDRLTGGAGADVIIGGDGADTVDGGDGDDDLSAGTALLQITRRESGQHRSDAAADRATGGAGKDVIRVGSGDVADGGAGDDLVVGEGRPGSLRCGAGARDRFDGRTVPPDCERIVWFGSESAPARTTLRGGTLWIRVPGYFGGRVTVRVSVDGRRVAEGSRRIPFDASDIVRLRVTPRFQRLLRRARAIRVDVRAPGTEKARELDTAVLPPPVRAADPR